MRQWILSALLLGIIAPAFAQSFNTPAAYHASEPLDDIALVINNESLTRHQLAVEMARERRLLPPKTGLQGDALTQQLRERVIMAHLLRQLVKQLDIQVSPEELNQAVANIAQQNGVTPARLFDKVRRDTGLDKDAYLAQLAETLAQNKLKQGLVGRDIHISPAAIDAQVAQIARQNQGSVELQDLLLPVPTGDALSRGRTIKTEMRNLSQALRQSNGDLDAVAQMMPQAQVRHLGQVNLAQIPPRFANAVASLPTGKVLDEPVIDKDGMHFLRVVARHGKGDMQVPEANVEHILLLTKTPQDVIAQKAVIDRLYHQLQQGADFHTLAAQYSQDPQSAARGGMLGWMGADQVVPSFAKAMLSVPLNTVSKPFRTPYGWHIIRVSGRRSVDRGDDVIRARIRDGLFNKYLEDAWQRRLIQLRQQAYVDVR